MPCLDFLSVIFQSWLLSATLVPSINYLKINAWWQTKSFLIITQYHRHNSMEEISLNISWEKKSRTKHGRSFTKFHWFACFLPQYLVPVSKASLHPPNLKPRLTHLSQHEGSWGLPPQSVILSKQWPRDSSAGTIDYSGRHRLLHGGMHPGFPTLLPNLVKLSSPSWR